MEPVKSPLKLTMMIGAGLTVDPTIKVQIKGEVDKGLFEETTIDVDMIQLAK